MSTNDYELSQVNRRTITENGVIQVVCGIGQVPIWSSDLKLLPKIERLKWKGPLSFLRSGAVFLSVNLMDGRKRGK
jgi:hypothetical protein